METFRCVHCMMSIVLILENHGTEGGNITRGTRPQGLVAWLNFENVGQYTYMF